jgi:pyruvate formate-lyase/glycerol dehydratase family glycyl radical enzyme
LYYPGLRWIIKKPLKEDEMTTAADRTPAERQADQVRYSTMMGQRFGRVGLEKPGQGNYIHPTLNLDIERARFITQSYKNTEGEPIVIRRAKAMANYLDNKTIDIGPNDLIAGSVGTYAVDVISYPELYSKWVDKAIDSGYRDMLNDMERAELHEINKYWLSRSVHGAERNMLTEQDQQYRSYLNHGVFLWVHGAHIGQMPNYEKLFKVGLNGIKKEAEVKLREIRQDSELIHSQPREFMNKRAFLEAVILSIEAAVRWVRRYAELARVKASQEKNQTRRNELERIAESCGWVPDNPPRTFFDTLQCWYLIMLLVRLHDIQTVGIGDRVDQIWYPAYKKDMEAGRITAPQAEELIQNVWLKLAELKDFNAPIMASGAHTTPRYITIGGQDRMGRDATNELTYMIMDSVRSLRLVEPMISVRLHRNTTEEFLHRFAGILRRDSGHYGIFNDEFMVPFLMSNGIPTEDARDWAVEACASYSVVGKPMGHRAISGLGFVLPKCLEYGLNEGRDCHFFSDKQLGAATPHPVTFTSIEDVIKAYLDQVKFFTEKLVTLSNLTDAIEAEWLPQPFNSALLDGCIENATDVRELHYWHKTNIQPVGHTTVVNALVAMKKLIFEEKKVNMAELLLALRDNWEGKEELRQMFRDAPKFGNDDDYVDLFAREIHVRTCQVMQSFKNAYGYNVTCDGSGGTSYFHLAGLTGATPDGRKKGDLFSDGTVSPDIGTDRKGPIAVLRSVAKIDPMLTFNQVLNQRFVPTSLEVENRSNFVNYLRTFIDLVVPHIEFNVIDNHILLEAKAHPENYQDLIVRVAGFSAYFVDMNPEIQDQIIARTQHRLT